MLVLSRKRGQSLVLSGGIEVSVISVQGESVRLGVKAPASVQVLRSELYAQVLSANQAAAQGLGKDATLVPLAQQTSAKARLNPKVGKEQGVRNP